MRNKKEDNFGWESEVDKIRRRLKISPKDKLTWLKEFNDFIWAGLTAKERKQRMLRRLSA